MSGKPDQPYIAELARLHRLAHRMDKVFRIPLIGVRIGWDPIIGLVPGVGDMLTLIPAIYILHRAHRLGVPPVVLARMGANIGIDAVIGAVPILGDLFDAAWKANIRNVDLLHRHFERQAQTVPERGAGQPSSHHSTMGRQIGGPR